MDKSNGELQELLKKAQEISIEQRKRLIETVKTFHLTYVDLEKMTGVAKSSIQRYLTGETIKIPADFFTRVSIATNTSLDYLLCLDNKKIAPIENNRDDLVKEINSLSEQEVDDLIQYAEFLKSKKQD